MSEVKKTNCSVVKRRELKMPEVKKKICLVVKKKEGKKVRGKKKYRWLKEGM